MWGDTLLAENLKSSKQGNGEGGASPFPLARDEPRNLSLPAVSAEDGDEVGMDISRLLRNPDMDAVRAALSSLWTRVGLVKGQKQVQREAERRTEHTTRERERFEAWQDQLTVIGGVAMTNAEAQEARQRVIDNDDEYADWAVAKGYIGAHQKDEFKLAVRRKMELEDKRGRGTLTDAEAREVADLDRSRVGHAVDAATAANHTERNLGSDMATQRQDVDAKLKRTEGPSSTVDASLFQSAPDLGAAFGAASPAAQDSLPGVKPIPVTPARDKAMGMDL